MLKRMLSPAWNDTLLFLGLSTLLVVLVLSGYRTFSPPSPYYGHLGCGEQCENIQRVKLQLDQDRSLLQFRAPVTHEDMSETDIMDSLADAQEHYSNLRSRLVGATSTIAFTGAIQATLRSLFYNTLFLLSVVCGLPFHLFFSLFLCCLMMTSSVLLSKITIAGHHQSTGKCFFLVTQMLLFCTTTGRMIVATFCISLLLYLSYLPSEKLNHALWVLYGIGLLLATVSRGVFLVVYLFFGVHILLRWNVLNVPLRTMLPTVMLLFLPFAISGILTAVIPMGIASETGVFAHGSLYRTAFKYGGTAFEWGGFREAVQGSYLVVLYAVALLPFIPRLSPALWLDRYFHAFSATLVVGGALAAANIGSCLLVVNALLVKLTILDQGFFHNMTPRTVYQAVAQKLGREGGSSRRSCADLPAGPDAPS